MKLARKLTLALVLGVFAVFALSAYVRVRREVGYFESDIRRDGRTMGRALSAALAGVWSEGGEARALRMVDDANARESEVDIRWVWLDAARGEPDAPELASLRRLALERGREVQGKVLRGDETHIVTIVPVRVPAERPGALELSESLAGERAFVRASVATTLFTTAGLAVVAGLVTTALGVWLVGRPMRTLILQARRIGSGDLSGRIALSQRDEIGELAQEMNAMCERLAEANARLEAEAAARIAALSQLRHADRLATVGKLASGLAHELGAPLQIVSGRAAMIADGEIEPAEVPASARAIHAEAGRMARIIRQLLDFARRRSAERQSVDLAGLARETCALLVPIAEKQGVEIVQTGEAGEGAPRAHVDPGQVTQALTNVVVNGVQAMPEGGRLEVDVRRARARAPGASGEDDYVAIAVRDEGVGMTREVVEHVFEPFFTTKPVGEGTGLGLSVTYGIVRDGGGFVEVESEPGKGSRFVLYFPRRAPGPGSSAEPRDVQEGQGR